MKYILRLILVACSLTYVGCASTLQNRNPSQVSTNIGRNLTAAEFEQAAKKTSLSPDTIDYIKSEVFLSVKADEYVKQLQTSTNPVDQERFRLFMDSKKLAIRSMILTIGVMESVHTSRFLKGKEKFEADLESKRQEALALYNLGTGLQLEDMDYLGVREEKLSEAFENFAKESRLSDDSISWVRRSVKNSQELKAKMDERLKSGAVDQAFYNKRMQDLKEQNDLVIRVVSVIEQNHTSGFLRTEKGYERAIEKKQAQAAELFKLGFESKANP